MSSIAHRVTGDGPHTVLWLHGWFGSSAAWGSTPRLLDGQSFRHVFVDYRGHGQRLAETGAYTLDEIADDVLALADELGAERFSLVGHSMGGAAALRVLARTPQRVRRLVGLSPVGASPTSLDDSGRDLFFGAPDDPAKRFRIVDFTTGNRNSPVWVNSIVAHSLERSTVDAFRGHLRAWIEADFTAELDGIEVPALALVGEHDPALGEATIRQTWCQLLPGCGVEMLANAGHYPCDETPVQTATLVERFLGE